MVQTIKKFGRPIMKPIKFIGKQFQNFRKGFKGVTKTADIAKTTNTLFPHIATGANKGGKAFEAGKQVRQTLKNFFGPGSKFGNLLNKLPFKMMLIGNKNDLQRKISYSIANAFANKYNMLYYECCAHKDKLF